MSTNDTPQADLHVLIVDDNTDFREAMRLLLPRKYHVKVVAVLETADEALAYEAIDEIDLILVDFKMPGMNGLAFTQAMMEREKHPKILLASFNPLPALREAAVNAGALDLLCKSEIQQELGKYMPPR